MSSGRHWGPSTAIEGPWRDVDGPGGWDRLVLPDRLIKALKAAPKLYIERVRRTHGVEPGPGEWLLFTGPAGTGKTSAAQTLANQLRLPLLEADAATWTGSLDELLGSASGHFAVLAIDHADALLSGGAEVAGQLRHWRRQLPSLVIFCVGSRRGLPVVVLESFDRVLVFPEPDVAARRAIWRRALPPNAVVPPKAINALGQKFELTGKEIVSCAVSAEAWCLEHDVPLTADVLADVVKDNFPGRRSVPPRRVRPRPASVRAVGVAAVGVIAAAALGLTLSHHSSPAASPLALDRQASVGPIRFSYPSTWRQDRGAVAGLSQSLSLTSSAGQLVLGVSHTQSAARIPVALEPSSNAQPELVALGTNRFYRALALTTAREAVYALPGTQGTVVGICKTASSAFAHSCEQVLATVTVTRPASTPERAQLAYSRALSLILATLNHTRTHLSAQLAQANDALGQSQALSGLASAHGTGAREVTALTADGAADANRALAAALNEAASAYGQLAQAAQRKDPSAYRAGQLAVDRANGAIRAALDELSARGFRIV